MIDCSLFRRLRVADTFCLIGLQHDFLFSGAIYEFPYLLTYLLNGLRIFREAYCDS